VPSKIKHYIAWGCLVIAAALSVGFSPSPSWAGAPADEGAALASETVQELHALYRTQKPDGSLEFRGPHLPLESFPILATLTLDLHRGHPDLAFVSHSAAAAARYYGYLFTTRDRNANLLVETNLRYDDGAMLTGIEDPVFNSLLSLDMISLARLNLEIRKPLQALYWYEGARILQERIVDRCFDIDANYFFPFDTNSGMSLHDYYALSVTPLLFNGNVGDNHAAGIINHYILREADVGPEPPWVYAGIGGPPAAAATASGETERSIKTLYLAGALRARGFEQKAVDAVRLAHRAGVDSATATTNRRPAASGRCVRGDCAVQAAAARQRDRPPPDQRSGHQGILRVVKHTDGERRCDARAENRRDQHSPRLRGRVQDTRACDEQ
jgi:hypothetical protein